MKNPFKTSNLYQVELKKIIYQNIIKNQTNKNI